MIEPSLALYGDAFDRVDRHLEDLLGATGVRYCLLVDRKGFVLSHKEALWAPRPPALDSVATLVASNAAATAALANMLGERTFSEQIHQGEQGTLYVESVGDSALLTLIFDVSVPLGRVKVHTKKTIAQVAAILGELQDAPPVQFSEDFSKGASALLDDLLG
ncbi:roadblock/LC7 domain-containing protein [Deinococcus metallilatus]|uniref:Regulator of Ras-like GTPase activity (Roadblock/LC7/MglB family) n=1 Tax=Deinococcus metallilatus TaxID=1211322 RepID=A0AAJ5F0V6_9DEIO|nr:roadblock/LC7 domain-containing protein [Deinococcus metallilatus]MBB5296844.1 putative regulator of Ras-like GTPase activity (Roadblock/LC7/MglB family) [Deinococcus metallilatus]QBY09579.1 roadblock/LC7 domain-containing protein [Deinococcus metallilatus]RXJ09183.1 roadblock/LC7 domain-containing protein [Deinococcus metallilatus]TLK22773.1 roadblock/LC7 domain-containing protein [Deinococcus metallilatus]GMA13876.1 gliding motility protein [Deinococcus metallilatus]